MHTHTIPVKNKRKWLAFLLAVVLLAQTLVLPSLAQTETTGAEAPDSYATATPVSAVQEAESAPADWAVEAFQMGDIYGLLPPNLMRPYTHALTRADVILLCWELLEAMELTGEHIWLPYVYEESANGAVPATLLPGMEELALRGEALILLQSLLFEIVPLEEIPLLEGDAYEALRNDEKEAASYALEIGLAKGRGDGLALREPITFQEMVVFLTRAYELIAYAEGRDSVGTFWKATHGENTLWLLGSIHIGVPELYPLSKTILSAYHASDALVVEADLVTHPEGIQYMLENAVYTDGTTLDQVLTADTYAKFKALVDGYGIPETLYASMRPWYAASLILALNTSETTMDAVLGIDMYFLQKALTQKPILEIEGLIFQTDLFNSFSPALQEAYLLGMMSGGEEDDVTTEDVLVSMLEMWKTGDVEGLVALVNTPEADLSVEMEEFNYKLIVERNRHMVEQAELWLNSEEPLVRFVVLGAAHMFGETGIATVLAERGYSVERVLR